MASVIAQSQLLPQYGSEAGHEPSLVSHEPESGLMQEVPSFSFPARLPTPEMQPSSSRVQTNNLPTSYKTTHRRARTSLNVAPLSSPFNLNPTPQTTISPPLPLPLTSTPSSLTQTSPASTGQPSPSRRHRRGASEFGGGLSLQDVGLFPPRDTASDTASYRSHRHRRSGAVSSQDLSSLMINHSSEPSTQSGICELDGAFRFGGDSTRTNENPHPSASLSPKDEGPRLGDAIRAVGFSDTVVVIPRPGSIVSSESGSSQSTVRDLACNSPTSSTPKSSLDDPSIRASISHSVATPAPFCAGAPSLNETPAMSVSDYELSQNFDEDPTATVVTETRSPWGACDYTSSASVVSRKPEARPSTSPSPDVSAGIIDLDSALVDLPLGMHRPNTASGYERKRASMHAGFTMSGFMASSSYRHRRTESAPSLAPPSFPSAFRTGSAADKGFEMENVFEEEEEDDEEEEEVHDPGTPGTGVSHNHTLVDVAADGADETGALRPSPQSTEAGPSSTIPSLLPAIQFDRPSSSERKPTAPANEASLGLAMPQPRFANSDPISASANSSPRCYQCSVNSCEPSPRFRKSVDDVPSLISGASTVASVCHPSLPTTSSASLEPGLTGYGSSYSLASSRKLHQKRASVISLSRLIGMHSKSDDDRSEYETRGRLQSSVGSKPPRSSRGQRLTRMLKFWKPRITED